MKMNNKSISTIDSKYNNFENEGLINENDKENISKKGDGENYSEKNLSSIRDNDN